jgi:hypothetical protein
LISIPPPHSVEIDEEDEWVAGHQVRVKRGSIASQPPAQMDDEDEDENEYEASDGDPETSIAITP